MGWTPEQYTAIVGRSKRILVSAAAGSGKTAVLVNRVIQRLMSEESPLSLEELVMLTFTNDAASEMRRRISEALSKALAEDPENRRLHTQLNLVQSARIMTVHSFCAALIRENFQLLGVNPEFKIISGEEESELQRKVLSELLEDAYQKADGDEKSPFTDFAGRFAGRRDDVSIEDLILETAGTLQNEPDPARFSDLLREKNVSETVKDPAETVWGKSYLERCRRELRRAESEYGKAINLAEQGKFAGAVTTLEGEAEPVRWLLRNENAGLDEFCAKLHTKSGGKLMILGNDTEEGNALKEEIKAIRDRAKKRVKKLAGELSGVTAAEILERVKSTEPYARVLLELSAEYLKRWEAEKKERGVLGFDDMEHYALRLLCEKWENDRPVPTRFARDYGAGIREIMVDEYQDTNRIQDTLFRCLSAGGADLFMVGDIKQSIYRFRRAEPALFAKRRAEGLLADSAKSDEKEHFFDADDVTVFMNRNFRSTPEVTESVNSVFGSIMHESYAEMNYEEGDRLVPDRQSFDAEKCKTEMHLIELKSRKDEAELDDDAEESLSAKEQEARHIAKTIQRMLQEGQPVYDGTLKQENKVRPARPSDIAVLVRSRVGRIPLLAKELTALGIPVSADTGDNIFESAEVNAVMALLSAVNNPWQEISLAGFLRSPFECYTSDELLRIHNAAPRENFYTALKKCAGGTDDFAERCRASLDRLRAFRRLADDGNVGNAVAEILDRCGAYAVFGAMPDGMARRENLSLIIGMASAYAENGGMDLSGFLRQLYAAKERGSDLHAPTGESEGVKLVTIHKSKGLEYPIVILAYTLDKMNEEWANRDVLIHRDVGIGMRYHDVPNKTLYNTVQRTVIRDILINEEKAESVRLLYVAMTRAKDKLILTGNCKSAAATLKAYAVEREADAADKCAENTSFGAWLLTAYSIKKEEVFRLLTVPAEENAGDEAKPTENAVCLSDYDWENIGDPADDEASEETPVTAEIKRRIHFEYPWAEETKTRSKMTATGLNNQFRRHFIPAYGEAAPDQSNSDAAQGLSPAEKGVAVHLALQLLPIRAYGCDDEVAAELSALAAKGYMTQQQLSAVNPADIRRFYNGEIGRLITDSSNLSVRREFRFSLLTPANQLDASIRTSECVLLQGVIDLFVERKDGTLVLVDYKTDRVASGDEGKKALEYAEQLAVYRDALERMTGKTVSRVFLWFVKTSHGEEISDLLNRQGARKNFSEKQQGILT